MSGVTKAISTDLLERCKKELKKQGVRGENGRRLQAIISAKKYGIIPNSVNNAPDNGPCKSI